MISKKSKASYTVEATFVMIIVLSVIFALIYLTFYLCDKSRIQDILDVSVIKISDMLKDGADIDTDEVSYQNILDRDWVGNILSDNKKEEEIATNYIEEKLTKGLIIADVETIDVEISKSDITIVVKANMNLALDEVRQYFTKEARTITFQASGTVHNPSEFMRMSEATLSTLEKIEGADTILNKLKEILQKVLPEN